LDVFPDPLVNSVGCIPKRTGTELLWKG
jgi:hypothetical protein